MRTLEHSSSSRRRSRSSPRTRLAWLIATAAVVFATVAPFSQSGGQSALVASDEDPYPNFDIRTLEDLPIKDKSAAREYLARFAAPAERTAALTSAREAGLAALQAAVPGVVAEAHPALRTLEVVSAMPGTTFLTDSSDDRVATLRRFLADHAAAYGLSAGEVAELVVVADYENPAGNMAWVELEQRFGGIPVFQGLVRGGFTAKGELARTTGILATGIDAPSLSAIPSLSAAEAISAAAADVGWDVPAPASSAWLVYFPLADGVARLAWATQIIGDPYGFLTVVDAETGTLLFRKNLTSFQTQAASYNVYPSDSPAPSSPTPARPGANYQAPHVSRQTVSLIGNEPPNTFNNLGWLTDGVIETAGNNVRAGLDLVSPDGIDATVTNFFRYFNFTYNPETEDPSATNYRNGEVTDMFYWSNRYHDSLYLLGFTEPARNFQNDNFGRGGVGNDRVNAEAQDYSGTNNANFLTPVDGTSGRMQMYIFTGPTPRRTSGLDHDVLIHELAHGTSSRLHSNASGLTTTMAAGMGEGWSDFYARALLSDASEDANGLYAIGGWVTRLLETFPQQPSPYTDNYYYGIRRFPYAVWSTRGGPMNRPHNPLTFADIDPAQIDLSDGAYPRGPVGSPLAFAVHNIGEVWASALLEVRARFITRLGYQTGHQRILQFVTDGMKLDPVNPTLLQGRDAILAAANAGGGTTADIADIWAGFAERGMGQSALVLNASTGSVAEAFNAPGLNAATTTLVSESIPNGRIDPGEEVGVSFCIANTSATASGVVTGTLVPGGGVRSPSAAQSYGAIPAGGTTCRTFTFNVSAACGGLIDATLQAQATGSATRNLGYSLFVGSLATALLQTFDGVTAPALPAGWTTSAGAGTNLWVTSAAAPHTAPNAAFAPNPGAIGDARLHSPAIAIPAAQRARLTFRNHYQTEYLYDGGVLEVSIGGGAFTDILAAGGSFVSGGYNATLLNLPGNPLAGRQGWTGTAGGYVTTVATLPDAVSGQTIVLRWRMGSDASVSATGWSVDSVLLQTIGCTPAGMPTTVADSYQTPFNTPLVASAPGVLANDTSNGGGSMTARLEGGPLNGIVALDANGGFTYTPNPGFAGADSFAYRAVSGVGAGNAATVSLTVQQPTNVQPPFNLRVDSVTGTAVTLRWDVPSIGPQPSQFVLEGGINPGEVLASIPTGSDAPVFTFAAPAGSFRIRMHGVLGADKSAASNEVPLHVNVPVPPSAPAGLTGLVNGSSLALAWKNTFGGGPPAGLVLDVSGSVATSIPLGLADSFGFAGVPAGTYTLSLRATNAAGASAASNAVTLAFPGACTGAPQSPANFVAYRAGNTVHVLWDAPANGPAATGYVLNVTGAFVGSIPTTGRSMSGAVGPGTYQLSALATNACGTSVATPVRAVTVP